MDTEVASVVRRAIDAINDRTIQVRAAELLDPSIVRHDLVQLFPDSQGAGAGSDFVGMIVASMPDIRFDIDEMFSSGDRVAVRLRMTGTHTGLPLLGHEATGRRLSANAVFLYRVQHGRVAEAWQMIDGLAFFRVAGIVS
jgi:predicted ester cyclase